jgi:uncharacterized protein YybS (DUF2232 family)
VNQKNWYPAIWAIIYVVLLLVSLTVPVVNIITIHLLIVPLVVLSIRLTKLRFILTIAILVAVMWGALGSIGLALVIITLFLLPTAIVLSIMYKSNASAQKVIIAGFLTLLGQMLFLLVVFYAIGLNPINQFQSYVQETANNIKPITGINIDSSYIDRAIPIVIQMIPLFMISIALIYVLITHGVARRVLNRSGIVVEALPPLREWRLPKSMLGYYILAVALDLFINIEADSILATLAINLMPIMTVVFTIQAFSFFQYVIHVKQWKRWLSIIPLVFMILIFPLVTLISWIGILDTVFPMRERIAKSVE